MFINNVGIEYLCVIDTRCAKVNLTVANDTSHWLPDQCDGSPAQRKTGFVVQYKVWESIIVVMCELQKVEFYESTIYIYNSYMLFYLSCLTLC